ncbi:unnamed protein product, partial [Allacma fusca]
YLEPVQGPKTKSVERENKCVRHLKSMWIELEEEKVPDIR